MSETEVDRFFKIMKDQNKMNKERYFEYIQFDLKFFDRLFDETNQTKNELEETKEELEQAKMKLKEAVDDIKQTKSEINKYTQSVIVAGFDKYNQLGVKSNNINKTGMPIISPPLILSYDHSSLLSYSIYNSHSVLVKKDGSLHGIGYNTDGIICGSLTKTEISQFTEFSINDKDDHQLTPISAVCSYNGTLYMLSKSTGIGKQLVYCDSEINGGNPIFLDIGNHEPIALFGGCLHAAAISKEGEIIFIQRELVKNSPNSLISAVSIPNNEKAKSIACCDDSIIVLSSNDRVFSSPVDSESNILSFSIVEELAGEEIVCISGMYNHFLAVSKEGRVFGCGSNANGRLSLGKETKSVSSFTEILTLGGYQIRSAYAGYSHSLFETCEGQILSCGSNVSGQLLINKCPSDDVYSPTETTIRGGAPIFFDNQNPYR